jgi:hypothetical protein
MNAMQKYGLVTYLKLADELVLNPTQRSSMLMRAMELRPMLKQYTATVDPRDARQHPLLQQYADDNDMTYKSAQQRWWTYRRALKEYDAWDD